MERNFRSSQRWTKVEWDGRRVSVWLNSTSYLDIWLRDYPSAWLKFSQRRHVYIKARWTVLQFPVFKPFTFKKSTVCFETEFNKYSKLKQKKKKEGIRNCLLNYIFIIQLKFNLIRQYQNAIGIKASRKKFFASCIIESSTIFCDKIFLFTRETPRNDNSFASPGAWRFSFTLGWTRK